MFFRRLPAFDYLAPETLEEALSLLDGYKGRARLMAGGTDLLVHLKQRKVLPRYVIGLKAIPGLDYIRFSRSRGLRLGVMVSIQSLADSPVIQQHYGLLAEAARKMGPLQVRNRGTIGGNLCNGGPSADLAAPLLALRARLRVRNAGGERVIAAEDFFVAPFKTRLRPTELLVEIQVATPPPGSAGAYKYLTKLTEVGETLVGAAAFVVLGPDGSSCREVRLGLCSVAPTPIRARAAESLLKGQPIEEELLQQVADAAAGETSPRSRPEYRRSMTAVLVRQALEEALDRARIEQRG